MALYYNFFFHYCTSLLVGSTFVQQVSVSHDESAVSWDVVGFSTLISEYFRSAFCSISVSIRYSWEWYRCRYFLSVFLSLKL